MAYAVKIKHMNTNVKNTLSARLYRDTTVYTYSYQRSAYVFTEDLLRIPGKNTM